MEHLIRFFGYEPMLFISDFCIAYKTNPKALVMKILFYSLWIGTTLLIILILWFNHYAEFHWDETIIDMLFNEYSRQWVSINAGITLIWFLLSCIGMILISQER